MGTSRFDLPPALLVMAVAAFVAAWPVEASAQEDRTHRVRWDACLRQKPEWYGGEEAIRIADNVLAYQQPTGGWPKNIDMAAEMSPAERQKIVARRGEFESIIDNGATHSQVRYLALVHAATREGRFAEGCRRGIEYLLEAQYDNGGWPMIFPLREGYYSHITFNDGDMIGVMEVLRDAASGEAPFGFLDDATRSRCGEAVAKGIECILKCQLRTGGKLTAWCAQHDEHDFSPAKARAYELPSLSGSESVGIVEFLMAIENPSPEVKQAIESAVTWLDAAKIEGQELQWVRVGTGPRSFDRVVVEKPGAALIWARFYEIGTDKPMFVGRDGVVREHLADIELERRQGYAYLGEWPAKLLAREYPAWKKKWGG